MARTILLIAALIMCGFAGCGGAPQTPCDDSDPVGICANSHSKTYGGG